MKENNLYNYDRRIELYKGAIEAFDNEENVEIVENFLEKLTAEGLSKARISKYAGHLKMMVERTEEKPFTEWDEQDVISFLAELERSDYSEWTKADYKVVLKRLFRYLEKEELTKDVKTTVKKTRRKSPDDLLTKEDITKMIEAAPYIRDKAIIAVLYEGGLRIGELGHLKIKNVSFDDYGAVIKVMGKTGERPVRLVTSTSILAKWLDVHPRRDERDAPLWVTLVDDHRPLTYHSFRQRIRKIAKKAGIDKDVHPHLFRHSRVRDLLKHLTEPELCAYMGWVQGSDMTATYVHLSGRDIDNRVLGMYGLKKEEEEKSDITKCPRCGYVNGPTERYCSRCGTVLSEEERARMDRGAEKLMRAIPLIARADPEELKNLDKLMDLMTILQKYPSLHREFRELVEKRKKEEEPT